MILVPVSIRRLGNKLRAMMEKTGLGERIHIAKTKLHC